MSKWLLLIPMPYFIQRNTLETSFLQLFKQLRHRCASTGVAIVQQEDVSWLHCYRGGQYRFGTGGIVMCRETPVYNPSACVKCLDTLGTGQLPPRWTKPAGGVLRNGGTKHIVSPLQFLLKG